MVACMPPFTANLDPGYNCAGEKKRAHIVVYVDGVLTCEFNAPSNTILTVNTIANMAVMANINYQAKVESVDHKIKCSHQEYNKRYRV